MSVQRERPAEELDGHVRKVGRWEGAKPFPEDGVTPPLERREEGKKGRRTDIC